MKIIQTSPTRIDLQGLPEAELRKHLTYVDKSVDFELNKARNSKWMLEQMGEEAWREHLAELKAKRTQCLLFEDSSGYWTYSGLGKWLASKFPHVSLENKGEYPEPQLIPWAKSPEKTMRPYQQEMLETLLKFRHAAVEVGTGLGKSFVILMLAKELGLRTVVMTPSVSIAEQIYAEFYAAFGTKHVGKYFGGKKDAKKKFVIAVDDSLTKVEPGSKDWNDLSSADVFIADESHLCPAASLKKVCFGLLQDAQYRFFFSGTQLRNDGLDLLLSAITGPIVFRMSVKEGVDQGYLAKPMFRMVKVKSEIDFFRSDPNAMTRKHLYYNDEVNSKAAEVANLMVEELNRPTVILVKELEQFTKLLPHLRHEVRFAHGGVTKDNKACIPSQYWDSDPSDLVDQFNEGKFPILVGTSCITTGTDIRNVKAIVYLQGGRSEIQVKQSVGRGTRKPEGKDDCYFIDFDVENIDVTHRHAEDRASLYQGIYPDYEEFKL